MAFLYPTHLDSGLGASSFGLWAQPTPAVPLGFPCSPSGILKGLACFLRFWASWWNERRRERGKMCWEVCSLPGRCKRKRLANIMPSVWEAYSIVILLSDRKKLPVIPRNNGSGGIWTHASTETGAWLRSENRPGKGWTLGPMVFKYYSVWEKLLK
jgi:hypothetical protein